MFLLIVYENMPECPVLCRGMNGILLVPSPLGEIERSETHRVKRSETHRVEWSETHRVERSEMHSRDRVRGEKRKNLHPHLHPTKLVPIHRDAHSYESPSRERKLFFQTG
jgi:hypothetical protein